MENKYTSLKFKAKVKPIEKLNEEFTRCKVYVQGIGKNRNYSYMSKENVIKNSPTLHYAPVVGHLIQKEDGSLYMGGHDWTIDENCNFKSICVPYGVVTMDEFEFEEIEEYGKKVEYMTASVVLWTGRYPELMEAIYSEDVWFNQSMEISVEQYRPYDGDSNYMELLDWTYSALCMLGKADDKDSPEHTEPCFIESKIIPYNFSKAEFADAMSEMKHSLAFYFEKKGDEEAMEEIKEVVVEDNMDVEESAIEEDVVETEEVVAEEPISEEENIESNVEPELEPETEVDIENAELNALQSEFNSYKESHSYTNDEYVVLEAQYNELKAFKETYDAAELQAKKDAIFAREEFASIVETKAFKKLIEDSKDYTLEECEQKAKTILEDCNDYIANFASQDVGTNKLKTIGFNFNAKPNKKKTAYGGLFDKDE